MESTGCRYSCLKCSFQWEYEDDYCPNCGGENFIEHGVPKLKNYTTTKKRIGAMLADAMCEIQKDLEPSATERHGGDPKEIIITCFLGVVTMEILNRLPDKDPSGGGE